MRIAATTTASDAKKEEKKLWRTSCLHGITKNVAKTQCSYRISHFRSVRFHTPFSSTFCCFLFHFALFCWFSFLSFLHQMLYCVSEMSFQSSADFSLEDGYQCLFLVKKMWPLKILFTCTEQMTGFCFFWTLFSFCCWRWSLLDSVNLIVLSINEFSSQLNETCAFLEHYISALPHHPFDSMRFWMRTFLENFDISP